MEPISITAVATAIATIFFTKAIEKTGEDLGKFLSNKTKTLIGKLDNKSTKIRNLLKSSQQRPSQIAEAVLEVKAIAERDPEIATAILEVEMAAKDEANPKFQGQINQVIKESVQIKSQQPEIQNMTKLADKIASVNQGYIGIQNITNNF